MTTISINEEDAFGSKMSISETDSDIGEYVMSKQSKTELKVKKDMSELMNELQDLKTKLRSRMIKKMINLYKRDMDTFLETFLRQIFYLLSIATKLKKKVLIKYKKMISKVMILIFEDILGNYSKQEYDSVKTGVENIFTLIFTISRVKKPILISNFGFDLLSQISSKANEQLFIKIMQKSETRVKFMNCVTFYLTNKKVSQKKLGMKLYTKFLTHVYKNNFPFKDSNNEILKKKEIDTLDLTQMIYINIITNDRSSEVRRTSLTNFELNKMNSKIIITRINDVSDVVKIEFLKNLKNSDYKFYKFSWDERLYLISSGVRNRNPLILDTFYDYFLNLVFGEDNEENDRDGLSIFEVKSRILRFLECFQFDFLRYYPKYHNDIRLFFRELMKRAGFVTVGKLIEIGAEITKDIDKCITGELVLIDIVIDLVKKPNIYLGESEDSDICKLEEKIISFFPPITDFLKNTDSLIKEERLTNNKKRYAKMKLYYFIRIMSHLVNYDESAREELIEKLEFLITTLIASEFSIEEVFEDYTEKYSEFYEEDIEYSLLEDLYEDHHELKKAYWLQEASETPLLLFEIDLFDIILKIYYMLSFKNHTNFTRKILEEINYNFDKIPEKKIHSRLVPKEQIIREISDQITQMSYIKNVEEIEKLREEQEKIQTELNQVGMRLTKNIRKAVRLFKSLLELIPIGQSELDVNLRNCNHIFEKIKRVPHKNKDMLISFLKVTSRYEILTENQAKSYMPIALEELSNEKLNGDYEEEDEVTHEVIKKCVILQSCFDCFMLYNLLDTMESQEDIDQMQEADSNSEVIIQEILKFLFSDFKEIAEICIKGIAKMLLHREYESQSDYLTFLLLLWQDSNLRRENYKSLIQLLTNFFYNYISQSFDKIAEFMNAGAYLTALFVLDGGCRNPFDKVKWEMMPRGDTFKVFLNTLFTLLSYAKNPILKQKRENDDWKCLGPFETIFVFILKLIRHVSKLAGLRQLKFLFGVIDPILPQLDFFEYCPKEILIAINNELKLTLDVFSVRMKNSNFGDLSLKLEEVIKEKTRIDLEKHEVLTPELQIELTNELDSMVKEYKEELESFYERMVDDSRTLYKDLKELQIASVESSRKAFEKVEIEEDDEEAKQDSVYFEEVEDESIHSNDFEEFSNKSRNKRTKKDEGKSSFKRSMKFE